MTLSKPHFEAMETRHKAPIIASEGAQYCVQGAAAKTVGASWLQRPPTIQNKLGFHRQLRCFFGFTAKPSKVLNRDVDYRETHLTDATIRSRIETVLRRNKTMLNLPQIKISRLGTFPTTMLNLPLRTLFRDIPSL